MLKSQKSQVTCSYCSRIFKDPIQLPCEDSICRQHLTERDALKANRIKCKKCNHEFGVKNNEFKSNEALNILIESQSHLSDEEISRKQKLEESIQKFFEYYDEFNQKKTQLESDVFDHFHEMLFQIDEHREELKKKIDDIALAMIDKIKKHEEIYLKELKKHFSSFDETQSLEHELNQIEEKFRQPNLLIQTIQESQQKQDESLNEIQFKLDEMNRVKDNLEATNEFKPNLSLFNQKDTSSLFGLTKLNGYSSRNPFKSEILINQQEYFELVNLCEFSPNDKWSLLYRGTRDGFGAKDFHSKCDSYSNTLTLLKAKGSEFIFGGFTSVDWDSTSEWKSDRNAFIFSLTNKDNTPLKMKIHPNQHKYAICCHSSCGPTFGDDIHIANTANTAMECCSRLGDCYKHPQYALGSNEAKNFLAGTEWFQLDEIEVYQKE
jgi:hypothetical protein